MSQLDHLENMHWNIIKKRYFGLLQVNTADFIEKKFTDSSLNLSNFFEEHIDYHWINHSIHFIFMYLLCIHYIQWTIYVYIRIMGGWFQDDRVVLDAERVHGDLRSHSLAREYTATNDPIHAHTNIEETCRCRRCGRSNSSSSPRHATCSRDQ